ncbi:hypothetical protein OAL70_02760 [Pelagibacteraceae bacterium]|nr:hypothetical protein [Pelagibacteraceae bacterium]
MSKFSKDVKKEIKKEIKNHWYTYIWFFLLTLFFIFVSKKIEIQLNVFGFLYWYAASLLMGHFAVNITKGRKKEYKQHFVFDKFVAVALVGAVNLATYGIPILLVDYFFINFI